MIAFDDVSWSYGNERVLSNVSLTLATGSATALIGRSGSGKTTLLRLAAGLLVPERGVRVDGEVAMILQSLGLFPWKTVRENVDLAWLARGVKRAEGEARTAQALADLDLTPWSDRYPAELSGGQAQRVAIARALVSRPDVLLMDEPSASLDALSREAFQDLVLGLWRRRPFTLVTVTHSIEEALMLGQRIVVMTAQQAPRVLENPLFGHADPRADAAWGPVSARVRAALGVGGQA